MNDTLYDSTRAIMLNDAFHLCCGECRYAESSYAECRGAD
jgi:hypothetical protein